MNRKSKPFHEALAILNTNPVLVFAIYFLGAAPVPANHTCEYQAAKAAGLFYFS